MNYEQKYKKALEWMQSLYSGLHGVTKEEAEHYFPELKEDKNENMRKALYADIRTYIPNERGDKYITWLEKQGENKKLDADKVIAWLVANILDYEYFVKWFKKDFGL